MSETMVALRPPWHAPQRALASGGFLNDRSSVANARPSAARLYFCKPVLPQLQPLGCAACGGQPADLGDPIA